MAKQLPYANRRGMDAALDLVEDALASLQEKVKQQEPERKDAGTNTAPLHSVIPKSRRKKQRETSVLINRRPSVLSDKARSHQHFREEAVRNKNQKSTPKARPPKHHRVSRHLPAVSLSSRSDTSHESCESKESTSYENCGCEKSNTSQKILRNSFSTGKSGGHKKNLDRLHQEPSHGITDSQRGENAFKYAGSRSSKKRDNRNRKRSPESSSDELLRRRKHKSRDEPPQNSQQSHQKSQEGGILDLRFLHKDHRKDGNVPSGQLYSSSHERQKNNRRAPSHCKKTIPVTCQRYAQPTLTSKFRDELSSRKEKEEKENITHFIPCGSKGKSYHVGVIVQQELGRLKNMTPKDLENLLVSSPSGQEFNADETGSDSEEVTEQTVRRALTNIHQHIALATKRTSKK